MTSEVLVRVARPRLSMSLTVFALFCLHGCQGGDKTEERVERLEQRMQATEFQISGMAELEPRIFEALAKKEMDLDEKLQSYQESSREAAEEFQAAHTGMQTDLGDHLRRLELVEAWIQEKDKEEEQKKLFAIEDGEIPPSWGELHEKCGMNELGRAQTVMNYLVRINAYMSDFPVSHPVMLGENDPMMLMTGHIARKNAETAVAYRNMELHILKARDRFLGYRIDRSWDKRPEYGDCKTACCRVDIKGYWACVWSEMHDRWGSEGQHSKWECEYDAEGWRDYRARWWRRCDYEPGTREFASMPYLMRRVEEHGLDIMDPLYCVVDLIWENRIYCLSHSQYPVLQIRLEEGTPEEPILHPIYKRFTLLAIHDWDVIYKDEWSSMWVVQGTVRPSFEGQQAGYTIEVIQEPKCGEAGNPEAVLRLIRELVCMDEMTRVALMDQLLQKHAFTSKLDFEIQKLWMEEDGEWGQRLDAVLKEGCGGVPGGVPGAVAPAAGPSGGWKNGGGAR
ncbi:MAG: hypothetical protein ABIK09_14340 [Pseudomonadota bacterium]